MVKSFFSHPKRSLVAVFCTFFLDNFCWSIVFPIFAPFFLDKNNSLFSSEVTSETRALLLGIFLMAFSLGQFIGSPILGEYADSFGRRKALLISILFTFTGIVLSAWSMGAHLLVLLFVGRFLTGVFAGNLTLCLAAVADLSENETIKRKYFGYLSLTAGISFVLGAFIGGKFSDSTINPSFQFNSPLWLAAALTFLNFLFVFWAFEETGEVDPKFKFSFLESFNNIKKALKTDKIKRIYVIYFLFVFGWTLLFQFIPVLMIQKFGFTGSGIGDLSLFMGICWAVGSGYLNKILLRYFYSLRILEVALLVFTAFCVSIAFATKLHATLIFLGGSVMIGGLAWPLCTSVISNMASKQMQGKILGMSQSMQSLSMTLAPAIGGVLFHFSIKFVFLTSALASLIAAIIYFSLKEH